MVVPPKIKESPYNPEILLLGISVLKIVKSRDSNKCCLHTRVHSRLIHYNQKEETIQVFTDGWMDKQCGVCVSLHTYDRILFVLKEWNFDTCSNMKEPGRCYAKWNKPDTKDRCYDSRDMKYLEQIRRDRK